MFHHLAQRAFLQVVACAVATLLLAGCAMSTFGPTGDFGATQGGVQDMGFARELIKSGRVPPPEAFVVEGMFSEHDLGLTGEPCERTLCLRTATAIAPDLDANTCGWLQVGMSSTIDMDTFQRQNLSIVACIDVSGSMGWDYATEQTAYVSPGQVSRNLLSTIAAELTGNDQIAIVTYGTTVNTVLPVTNGSQQVTIQAAIDSLTTGGVTDMESGLRRAYEIARSVSGETPQVRVMLFTDIQPNVGAVTATEFEQIVADGADDGIGLTVFGVGVGMRQELMNAISHLRDGNAFSLFDNEDVVELMDDSWPWMVSPIAYNLALELTPAESFVGADAYGFPSAGDSEEGPKLETATVFLSRRKGALLVRFEPQGDTPLSQFAVTGRLTYQTPEGEPVEQTVNAAYAGQPLDEHGRYFDQPNVGSTLALAMLVSGMNSAAQAYATDRDAAIATMEAVVQRFSDDMSALNDASLDTELQLAQDMLNLMQQGADQGDLYGYGVL